MRAAVDAVVADWLGCVEPFQGQCEPLLSFTVAGCAQDAASETDCGEVGGTLLGQGLELFAAQLERVVLFAEPGDPRVAPPPFRYWAARSESTVVRRGANAISVSTG